MKTHLECGFTRGFVEDRTAEILAYGSSCD